MENVFNPDVYLKAFKLVRAHIITNSGNFHDVEDILQEGLLIFFRLVKSDKYEPQERCEFYILKICTNLWLKELKRRRNCRGPECRCEIMAPLLENAVEIKIREEVLYKIIERNVPKLSPRCKEVFLYRRKGLSYQEIALMMDLQSDMIAKDKYFRSKKQLIELVKNDPEYTALME